MENHRGGEWAHPLFDGKPLEAWPMVPLVQLGMPPLLAMRGLHVLAGMGATVLIYRLALELNGRAGAFDVAAALFAICPFEVYLQRLALSDILLSTAGLWVLLRSIRFLESPSAANAAALSGTLLLAAICKLPVGFIFLLAMPLALALMPAKTRLTLLRRPVVPRLLAAHAPAFLLALAILAAAAFRLQRGQPAGFGIQDLLGIGAGSYTDIAAVIGVARPNLMTELSAQLSWPVSSLGRWSRRGRLGRLAPSLVGVRRSGAHALHWPGGALLVLALPAIHAAAAHRGQRARVAGADAARRALSTAHRMRLDRDLRRIHGSPIGAAHRRSSRRPLVAIGPLPVFRGLGLRLRLPASSVLSREVRRCPG